MTILEYTEFFIDWLYSPRVRDNISSIILVLIIGSLVLEFSKVKFSPWTWGFKKLGKVLNSDVRDELKVVNERLTKIEDRQDRAEHQEELKETLNARRRILRARNDLLNGHDLNIEYMRNLMTDIASYEDYCTKHSDVHDEWHFSNKECPEAIETLTEYNHELERRLRKEAKQKDQD